MKQPIVPYLKCRDQLPIFTILNCISWKLPYKWIGHTAIVFVDPITGQVMVFESTTLNKWTGKSGVQMMPMGAWLAHYPGKVYARVPKFGDSSKGAEAARELMAADFIKEHLGSSYPDLKTRTGRFKLYLSALDFRLFGRDWFTYTGKDNGIFCTMLVIMMLQACDLFDKRMSPNEYEPDDTRKYDNYSFSQRLEHVVYKEEIRLK
jgi:hypothetical protein